MLEDGGIIRAAIARILGDEVEILALADPLEHLAENQLALAAFVAFGGVDVADACGDHGLNEARLQGPAGAHAEPGDFLAGFAENDLGQFRLGFGGDRSR